MSKSKLSPVQLHVIAQAAKSAQDVRDELREGKTYRPDFAARFHGELSVGVSQPTTSSSKFAADQLIAWLLTQFGPRKRKTIADELIRHAEVSNARKPLQFDQDAKELADRIIRETTTSTAGTKRGNVTGKIICELV